MPYQASRTPSRLRETIESSSQPLFPQQIQTNGKQADAPVHILQHLQHKSPPTVVVEPHLHPNKGLFQ
jgi:hypothetical protein